MVVFPSCKINLGLHIQAKRSDGFHDIETIFYPIYALSDMLEIIPAKNSQTIFKQEGIFFENEGNNIVEKAYSLLKKKYNIPAIEMFLYKKIPVGAGLGGGSSDAAFTLKLLNKMFQLGLNTSQLKQYAALLGSDCAFFIDNIPALGSGLGEKLTPCPVPQLTGKQIIIVKPNSNISTADAYKNCNPYPRNISLAEIISLPLTQWKDVLENDFEKTIFPIYPELRALKEMLYKQGAIYASMSGSGSALFGIFPEQVSSLDFEKKYFVFQGKL